MRAKRLTDIYELVTAHGTVTVDELVAKLGISPATARRDLDQLDSQGLLRRTRGGASAHSIAVDATLRSRNTTHADAKRAIARKCTEFLRPGYVVGLTGGSTVAQVAQALVDWVLSQSEGEVPNNGPMLTVVTNAVDIAGALASRANTKANIKIVVIGGVLNHHSNELTGPFSLDVLGQVSLDLAFIGVNGFDDNGPGTVDEYEAQTNRAMATRAQLPVVVADSSKFGKRSFSSVGDLEVIHTIVTDRGISAEQAHHLSSRGYTLHYAD